MPFNFRSSTRSQKLKKRTAVEQPSNLAIRSAQVAFHSVLPTRCSESSSETITAGRRSISAVESARLAYHSGSVVPSSENEDNQVTDEDTVQCGIRDGYLLNTGDHDDPFSQDAEWNYESDENRGDDEPYPFDPEAWGMPAEPAIHSRTGWDIPGEESAATEPKKRLSSWVSPLPEYDTIPEADRIELQGETFPFLSCFLSEPRQVDLPFPKRHGLARFLLTCTEKTFYRWMRQWRPSHLELLGIWEADELELERWILLVKHLGGSNQYDLPPEANVTQQYWCSKTIESIRHTAVHRHEYTTSIIRCIVEVMLITNDLHLIQEVEQMLRTLFSTETQDLSYSVTDNDIQALDCAISFSPARSSTPHRLLGKLSYLLEKVCFDYAVSETTCEFSLSYLREPHGAELHNLRFRPYFDKYADGEFASEFEESCIWLRHTIEHKYGFYTDLDWVKDFLRTGKNFAKLLDDFDAVAATSELETGLLPPLEAKYAERFAAVKKRSEEELRNFARQAKQFHEQWLNDYQLSRFDYHQEISGRYKKSWAWYEELANEQRRVQMEEQVPLVSR